MSVLDDLAPATGPVVLVAVGRGGVIGSRGRLPWHAPEDLAHFKAATRGHHVVMGATTWESIGRPLAERVLVVVSRRALDLPEGVILAGSPDEALARSLEVDPAPVIAGGSSIYTALLPAAVRLIRTDVDVDVPAADTWFPLVDADAWHEVATWPGADERLTFRVLDRSPV